MMTAREFASKSLWRSALRYVLRLTEALVAQVELKQLLGGKNFCYASCAVPHCRAKVVSTGPVSLAHPLCYPRSPKDRQKRTVM